MTRRSRRVLISALVAALAGAVSAGAAMYVAWDHNPQCEIHCDGNVDWPYWLLIGGSWFVPVFVGVFLLLVCSVWAKRAFGLVRRASSS